VPLIFSYGSLQEAAVQLSVYGRVLRGEPDALLHCMRETIAVPPWHKAAASGVTHYANVVFDPDSDSRVEGTVLDLTDAELVASDGYEQEADYVRVMTTLASGRRAWVYLSAAGATGYEDLP
jgi:gamma-glutamylcyclotransferase (GGCT)/AIG2-like uncharacterized protein YtfP